MTELTRDSNQVQSVTYERWLDVLVQRAIACQRRTLIDLDEPRLVFCIEEDIETEELIVFRVFRFENLTPFEHQSFDWDDRLDHDVFDGDPQVWDIYILSF